MKQLYMLKTKRRGIFLALLLLMALPMAAQQVNERFYVGGLQYSVLDPTKHTIKVLPKAIYLQLTDEADDATPAYLGELSGVIDLSQPIPYKGKSWMVTEIDERAFQLEKITKVILPDGITKIGYKAFFKMPLLTTINFPASLKIIESKAFYGGVLTAVDIPSQTAIGSRAFESCTKMETLSIPQVTYMGNACFRHCSKLASVTVPVSAKIGQQATKTLSDDNKLTDGTNQVSGQHAFADCYGLKNATIQEGSTMVPKSMFMFCGDLTTVNVPTTVTSIEDDAFRHCCSLNAIDIQNVESIGNEVFWNCLNLKGDLILSGNVKKIGNHAFAKTGFTGVKWEGTAGCTIGNNIFSDCYFLEYVDLHTLTNPTVSKTVLKRRTGNAIDNLAGGLLSRTIVYLPQGVNFTFAEGEDVNFVKSNGSGNLTCTKLSVQDGADYEFPVGFTASTAVYNKWEVEFDRGSFKVGEEKSFTDRKTYTDDNFICYEDDYDTGEIMPLITYRDFTGSGNDDTGIKAGKNCFTMLLPYEVKLPKGFRAYELHLKDNYATPLQGQNDYTQYYLFRSIPDESKLEANKPYLLRIVDGNKHDSKEFNATNVEIVASGSVKVNDGGTEVTQTPSTSALRNVNAGTLKPQGYKATKTNQNFMFVGGTERLNNELAINLNTWLLNTDYMGIDVWRKVKKAAPHVGDGKLVKPTTAAPFRGYIQPINNVLGNAKRFVVLMEGETTGIDDLQQDKVQNGAQRIYTLDGRYVGTSFDTLLNGIYIIKGKKIVK